MMVQCNAMSVPVDDNASSDSGIVSSNMQMVRCNAMAWTDETEGAALKMVLVTHSDPVTGIAVTTAGQTMLTGTPAERCYIERKWWERLWQAMPHVQKRKRSATARAVQRATKHQCKKHEFQAETLLAKARDWNAHVLDQKSVESVTRQATLLKECMNEARALTKRKGETLQWLECLSSWILKSNCLVLFVERQAGRSAPRARRGNSCHGGARGRERHLDGRRGGCMR